MFRPISLEYTGFLGITIKISPRKLSETFLKAQQIILILLTILFLLYTYKLNACQQLSIMLEQTAVGVMLFTIIIYLIGDNNDSTK